MTTIRRVFSLLLAGVVLALPTMAFALETTDEALATTDRVNDRAVDAETDRAHLEAIRERALDTIARQLEALRTLGVAVEQARFIADDHAAQLLRDVATASDGLTELARQIESAATVEELRALIEQIDDYKIAQVLAPKTHLVIASDTAVAAARKLEGYAGTLAEVIERFDEAGFDVVEARRLLGEMEAATTEGLRLAGPVAEAVIELQAADWPDPAERILAEGRSDMTKAKSALRSAATYAHEIAQVLRQLHDGAGDAAATG